MFISESQYIGFDIGKELLRIARVRKTRHGWDVTLLKEISSSDSVNLLYKQLSECVSVSPLKTRDVLFRPCDIPLKKRKDVMAALEFHVESLIPYPLESGVLQAQVVSTHETGSCILALSTRKDHLSRHLDEFKKYPFEPQIVTTKAHAFAALSHLLPQTGSSMLIVHESEEEITVLLIDKGQIAAARSIDAKKDVVSEVQKALLSLPGASKSKSFETIYFFGKDPALKQALQAATGKEVLAPSSPLLNVTQEELVHYGLALGCALAHEEIDFRQKEFVYPHPFRPLKKPLIAFFSLSLAFAICLSFFSHAAINHKKRALAAAYTALCKEEGKEVNMHPQTPRDYLRSLDQIEKAVAARPATFPLLPQTPKVKEVLGWLSSLPESEGITIDSLHYQMVKHPDFSNRNERYKVRVELELDAPTPQAARLFQEALKCPGPIVDNNEDIQWLPAKGKYKASFYLKDKTRYE